MERRDRLMCGMLAAVILAGVTAQAAAAPPLAEPVVISTHTRLAKADTDLRTRDVVVDGVTLVLDGPHRFRSLWLRNGAVITHDRGSENRLELTIDEGVRIDPACAISGTGRGGGFSATRAPDGGAIRLTVGGVLSVDGWIAANGKPGALDGEAGGHGGSVQIIATALVGEGRIVAQGGEAGPTDNANTGQLVIRGGDEGAIRIRVGTTRGVGVVSAVAGIDRAWGGARLIAAAPQPPAAPVLEIDPALFPEGGGAPSQWAMWQVEGSPETGWALVEE